MNVRPDPHADFGAAIFREMGVTPPAIVTPTKPRAAIFPPLRSGDLDLGLADTGGAIGVDLGRLIEGRLLIQGASGAGKSWTLRRILEQSVGKVQQIVVDPEGEFSSLADANGFLRLDASRLDIAALAIAAKRIRAHRLSVLLDLSDCEREGQMIAIATFLRTLIDAPRDDWHAALVVIDEVHLFAPFGGDSASAPSVRKAAIGAVTDLMSRGRKRGLCGILATQRLARLAKSVVSEATNFLIGLNTLDLDIRRAAETIGWDARRAFDRLPVLSPGEFVATGSAFSRSPCVLHVGNVETLHKGAAPCLTAPSAFSVEEASGLVEIEALIAASETEAAARTEAARPEGTRIVRAFIREAGFAIAGQVLEALTPLAPQGARLADMAEAFKVPSSAVVGACALLDRYGVLEFEGAGADRAARLARGFRS